MDAQTTGTPVFLAPYKTSSGPKSRVTSATPARASCSKGPTGSGAAPGTSASLPAWEAIVPVLREAPASLGVDIQFTPGFEFRVSGALGDYDGIAIGVAILR